MAVYERSVTASLLILAIVVLRALALHRLPKATFLVLWGVTICRLLVPFSIPSPLSIYAAFEGLNRFLPQHAASIVPLQQAAAAAAPSTGSAVQPDAAGSVNPVWMIWVIGTAACALFFLATHFRFRRVYGTALPVESPFVDQWLRSHRIGRSIQVRQLDRINAPLTYGILHPVILLPKGMDFANEQQMQYVLAHELVHKKGSMRS